MEETARGRDEAYREQGAAGGDIEQPCARAAMHSNASSADGAAQPKHGFFTVEFIFYALLIAVRAPPATSCIIMASRFALRPSSPQALVFCCASIQVWQRRSPVLVAVN
eukprot:TRINITY_DN9503_c0_g1_i2.p3 TRINITY_DN9503_c0_g1~~TRINITY_DN9503_c0_g1_i2.p3  ORF type:complete len:109 (-),score=18.60 TRINITY_DN9503_c0_g1_i2:293-619(-)